MRDSGVLRRGLGVLQNVVDLFTALALVIGGWNATNSHPIVGYSCMVLAAILLYLSSGMWTIGRGKLTARIVFYSAALLALGVSVAILSVFRALPATGRPVIFWGVGCLSVVVLLALIHLRLSRTKGVAAK
jgi:hypothetical protein